MSNTAKSKPSARTGVPVHTLAHEALLLRARKSLPGAIAAAFQDWAPLLMALQASAPERLAELESAIGASAVDAEQAGLWRAAATGDFTPRPLPAATITLGHLLKSQVGRTTTRTIVDLVATFEFVSTAMASETWNLTPSEPHEMDWISGNGEAHSFSPKAVEFDPPTLVAPEDAYWWSSRRATFIGNCYQAEVPLGHILRAVGALETAIDNDPDLQMSQAHAFPLVVTCRPEIAEALHGRVSVFLVTDDTEALSAVPLQVALGLTHER